MEDISILNGLIKHQKSLRGLTWYGIWSSNDYHASRREIRTPSFFEMTWPSEK